MSVAEPVDIRTLIRQDPAIEAGDIRTIERAASGPQVADLRREVIALQGEAMAANATEKVLLRAGIGSYILGQHEKAASYLGRVPKNGVASYYEGLALTALDRHSDAESRFDQSVKNGYDKVEGTMQKAGSIRRQGRLDEAEQVLRSVAKEGAGRAEYSYQLACILSDRGDTYGAVEYFERAVDMDPHHSRALFRLAAENSLRGNDDEAIRLYEQSLSRPPHYLGALLNLGLLYEDSENYPAAAYCFRRILEFDPNHGRARLYLKDIEATSDMYYDEESARLEQRMEQLLSRPVTDFELSVRSRNCLESMGIFTLGDLTRVSEQELLAGKNFGETSLHEIRDMLTAHGLGIGQNLHRMKVSDFAPQDHLSPQERAQLGRPISDLNLSVRARKCMTRLGITAVSDLVQRTADELLGSRNFGVTSLNEVRAKLGELGLKLRND